MRNNSSGLNTISSPSEIQNVRKIGVLRANALGDFIVTLPALQAIRAAYPDAEIVLLGKPWHQQFLVSGRIAIDRVVIVPIKTGIRSEAGQTENELETAAFVEQMRHEEFDIVFNFQGNGLSANPFIRQFGARLTAGLCTNESERLDLNLDYYYYQSEVIRFLEVVKLAGASTVELEPSLKVLPQDELEAFEFLSGMQDKRYVVLHPVAMDTRRMWSLENFAPLANELVQRGYEVVFTGSLEDKDAIEQIISSMNAEAVNTCGKFSLGGLASILSHAALMIAADTGPLHLARAVGTSTIGFYWAPNLINWGPLTRAKHRPLVSWKTECPVCGTVPNDPYPYEPKVAGCDHPVSFVRDITIDQVMKEVNSLESMSLLQNFKPVNG